MGGYLTLHGRRYDSGNKETLLADLTRPALKGQRRLYVSGCSCIDGRRRQRQQWDQR